MTMRHGLLAILGLLAASPVHARAHGHHSTHGHSAHGGSVHGTSAHFRPHRQTTARINFFSVRPHQQVGIASYYAASFHGRTMADGGIFLRNSNSAASLTLPLGTVARVTNRANHHSAIVVIRDRGPYVRHRIIDVSPATAGRLGFKGLAPVMVFPLHMAAANGR